MTIRYQSPADTIPDIGSPVTAVDAKKAATRAVQKMLMPVGDAGHQGDSCGRVFSDVGGEELCFSEVLSLLADVLSFGAGGLSFGAGGLGNWFEICRSNLRVRMW